MDVVIQDKYPLTFYDISPELPPIGKRIKNGRSMNFNESFLLTSASQLNASPYTYMNIWYFYHYTSKHYAKCAIDTICLFTIE